MHHAHKVSSGEKVKLDKFDAGSHAGLTEEEAHKLHAELGKRLDHLQALMYAAGQTSMLIVLQGLDTSGKDGTIRRLMGYVNPQSCRVSSFKVPSELERSHDFLWRVHQVVPPRGLMTIFNRSHYEDVLVVRVHELAPKKVWRGRYEHINAFESLLTDSGCIVLKFFLHISKDEQERRLLEREQEPDKAWKLAVGDWKEREHWKDYTSAYEDALSKCSTKDAPWFIVPSNHKWYRDLAIIERIVEALEEHKGEWRGHLKQIGENAKNEIAMFRGQQTPK